MMTRPRPSAPTPGLRATGTPARAAADPDLVGAPPFAAQAGIFLISAATLLFQVTFIRIFSAVMWYHFAFLVGSIALFGLGASGVGLALLPDRTRDAARRAAAPALFALTAIGAYVGTAKIPFSPFFILQQPVQVVYFLLYDLLLLVPFFFSGATVALILRSWPARAGRLYAYDLVGAACGTVLLFVALPALDARGTVALAATLGAGSALLLAPAHRGRIAAAVLLAALLPIVLAPRLLPDTRLDETKPVAQQLRLPGGRLAFRRRSPLARMH